MLTSILILQAVLVLAILVLLLRQPKAATPPVEDPRLAQLADQITRMDARGETLERHLREALAQLRVDLGSEAHATREAANVAAATQRTELQHALTNLRSALDTRFDSYREDNKTSSEALRLAVQTNLDTIAHKLSGFISDAHSERADAQATLHTKLNELGVAHTDQQEKLRTTVQERLDQLNTTNTAKLEEMRATVDEKLQSTLHTRLTESFGQVTDQQGAYRTWRDVQAL